MLFAPYERYQYARAPLVEVICQLRFPTILSIGAKEPAEFQEAIRKDFPQYAARQEQLPPKVVKKGNATALEPQKPITNYNFISEDGRWKLNLTQGFIALSTSPPSSSASACGMSTPSPASVWAWRGNSGTI